MSIKNRVDVKDLTVYVDILFDQNAIFVVVANALVSLKLYLFNQMIFPFFRYFA